MDDDDKETVIADVRLRLFMRENEAVDYALTLDDKTECIDAEKTSISWTFPDGTSQLDKVVVDGRVFEGADLGKMMSETGIAEGSVVEVYRTSLDEDDDA
jgi:hypothetical protein